MLANHVYWNLGAFVDQASTLIYDNTLYMPYADRYIETDGILIPTGQIGITNGTALGFTQPNTKLGPKIQETNGTNLCGTGCVGIDNAFILDRPRYTSPEDPNLEVLTLSSPSTGIQLSLETNMQGTQIYTCNGQNGSIKVKKDQQHLNGTTYVQEHGCIVIEAQDVSSNSLVPFQMDERCTDIIWCSGSMPSITHNGDGSSGKSSHRHLSLR
jgi:aldose 1-epimerase